MPSFCMTAFHQARTSGHQWNSFLLFSLSFQPSGYLLPRVFKKIIMIRLSCVSVCRSTCRPTMPRRVSDHTARSLRQVWAPPRRAPVRDTRSWRSHWTRLWVAVAVRRRAAIPPRRQRRRLKRVLQCRTDTPSSVTRWRSWSSDRKIRSVS